MSQQHQPLRSTQFVFQQRENLSCNHVYPNNHTSRFVKCAGQETKGCTCLVSLPSRDKQGSLTWERFVNFPKFTQQEERRAKDSSLGLRMVKPKLLTRDVITAHQSLWGRRTYCCRELFADSPRSAVLGTAWLLLN